MKILLITQNFYPEIGSGANRYKNIFKELHDNGINADVLTTIPSYPNPTMYKNHKYYCDSDINRRTSHIHRMCSTFEKQTHSNLKRVFYYIEIMIKTYIYLKKNGGKYECIIVTTPNIFLPIAVLMSKRNINYFILDIRDLWPDSIYALNIKWINIMKPLLNWIEKKIYNSAKKIIYNHEGFKLHILNKLTTKKELLYIPNSLNSDELLLANHKINKFTVFYTGNIGYAQNLEDLFSIAKELNRHKIYFDIIPYGLNANKFKDMVKESNLEYIKIYDVMPRQECLKFMKERHISLSFLKEDEVFMNVLPGKIIDSISLGVPVVTNVGNDTMYMINKHNLGLAKDHILLDDVIDYILEMKENEKEYNEVAENCMIFANKNFVWNKNIKKVIKLLKGD